MIATFLKGFIFPVFLIGSFYAFHVLLEAQVNPGIALFGLTLLSLALIAGLEWLLPYRQDWSWWTDRQVINDILHGAALSTIGPKLGEVAFLSVAVTASAWVASTWSGGVWPSSWPFWAQVILAILIADFLDWAKHWLYHHTSFLWPIHALHHNPDRLHFAKAGRLHFLESTIRFSVISVPFIILGVPPLVLFWFAASQNFLGNLNHSNIDMPVPSWLHYFIATPQCHRLHHAKDHDLGRSNLSSFTLWPDHVFGTFRHPDKHPYAHVGIEEDPIPQNLLAQLATPFIWPFLVFRMKRAQTTKPSSGE